MSPSNVDKQMDQKFYNELNNSIEFFLKENQGKWTKDYRVNSSLRKKIPKVNEIVNVIEVTLDSYETWANFYNQMSFWFCGLSASKKKDHFFRLVTVYPSCIMFGKQITKLKVDFCFVDKSKTRFIYQIDVHFEKGTGV